MSQTNEEIPFAQILKLSVLDSSIVNYTVATHEANYEMGVDCSSSQTLLLVRSLGYHDQYLSIPITEDIQKNIVLQEKATLLEKIEIIGDRPIIEKGDTTTFSVGYFSDGTEENVEDIIKKTPNFKVDDNGTIKYKGNIIEKILLDGDDMVGKDYKIISKNLSAGLISKIDVIENYTEERNFQGIVKSDKIALNLQIKENRKSPLFGTLSANTDFFRNYRGLTNLLSYSKNTKFILLGEANTIGKNPSDYENNSIEIESSNSSAPVDFPLSISAIPKIIDASYYNENESQYGSFSIIQNVGSFQFKNQFGITHINNGIRDEQSSQYFNENSPIIRLQNNDLSSLLLKNTFKATYTTKRSGFEFIASHLLDGSDLHTQEVINRMDINTSLEDKNREAIYSLKFSNKINATSAWLSRISYAKKVRNQDYFNSINLFSNILSTNGIQQSFSYDKKKLFLTNKFVKRYNHFDLSLEAQTDYEEGDVTKNNNLDDSLLMETVEIEQLAFHLIPTFKYRFGKSVIGFSPSVTYTKLNVNATNEKVILPNFSVFLRLKVFKKSRISFLYAQNTSIIDLMLLNKTPTLLDANLLNTNNLNEIGISKGHSIFVNYHKSFASYSSYYFSVLWSKQERDIQNNYVINENRLAISPQLGSGDQTISLTVGGDKYVNFLAGTIALNTTANRTQVPVLLENILSSSTNYSLHSRISFVSGVKKIIHFNVAFSDYRFWSAFSNSQNSTWYQKLAVGVRIKPIKKVSINISNQWYFIKDSPHTIFLNIKSLWKINKKFSIGLEGRNLLNYQQFILQGVNNQFLSENKTFLRNPLILARFDFNF